MDTMTAALHVTWKLSDGVTFAYDTAAPLTQPKPGGPWVVDWSVATVHPRLRAGGTLNATRSYAPRADILGADDSVLVTERPVVHVGIEPSRVTDIAALTTRLQQLFGIDPKGLTARVKASAPHQFVDVITLRRSDYDADAAEVKPLPGTVFQTGELPLAADRTFARALLGSVGPVTAEIQQKHPGEFSVGQDVGLTGLQEQYQKQLAGTPGLDVTLHPTSGTGVTLLHHPARPGKPLRTTLDARVQAAADSALAGQSKPSALVALRVSTGDVLAVANGPDGGGYDLALTAEVPPGSTFKMVTTLALLEGGLTTDTPVPCEPQAVVGGRSFHNAEHEAFGVLPFATDFVRSCNTAFVSLAPRLAPDSLAKAARSLGIGVPMSLGTTAYAGSVPVTSDPVDKAASAFGQGRILVSPMALAVATTSVAHGARVSPQLVVGSSPAPAPGAALPAAPISTLRQLMREVVTSGTGTAVAAVPGGPVYGKTGTAEHGSGPNPPSHAWFTGWQGDIAFCVFVQDGEFGGDTAAPIAGRFLTELSAGS